MEMNYSYMGKVLQSVYLTNEQEPGQNTTVDTGKQGELCRS